MRSTRSFKSLSFDQLELLGDLGRAILPLLDLVGHLLLVALRQRRGGRSQHGSGRFRRRDGAQAEAGERQKEPIDFHSGFQNGAACVIMAA